MGRGKGKYVGCHANIISLGVPKKKSQAWYVCASRSWLNCSGYGYLLLTASFPLEYAAFPPSTPALRSLLEAKA